MATHSSILAWRIPWTEEPGGLQSTGVTKEFITNEQLTLSLSAASSPGIVLYACEPVMVTPLGMEQAWECAQ